MSFIYSKGSAVLRSLYGIAARLDIHLDMSGVLRWIDIMASEAKLVGIRNSWSLVAFAKSHGKMQVGEFVNKETNESFKSCIFTNPEDNSRSFVAFSSRLGELTPAEIAARKDDLQVVELESGNYSLCAIGANAWEDVDLGI